MNKSFSNALEEQSVIAKLVDIDYHRNFAAFGSVETHYIIQVRPSTTSKKSSRFATFRIGKSFKDFRTLVNEFKRASNETTDDLNHRKGQAGWKNVPESTQNFIAFSDAFSHVIDKSPKAYLTKMSFDHVEKLSLRRKEILEEALKVILENYPEKTAQKTAPVDLFKKIVLDFFLTDHIYDDDDNESIEFEDFDYEQVPTEQLPENDFQEIDNNDINNNGVSLPPEQYIENNGSEDQNEQHDVIRPKSLKKRLSQKSRMEIVEIMKTNSINIDDGDNYVEEKNTVMDDPKKVFAILFVATHFFLFLPDRSVTIPLDMLMIMLYTSFVAGICIMTSSRNGKQQPTYNMIHDQNEATANHFNRSRADSTGLAKRVYFGDKSEIMRSVPFTSFCDSQPPINGMLEKFPHNAELGTVPNCWSPSVYSEFLIRGATYLQDRIKIPSEDFLFPARGVDFFLSDCCPENIGRYKVCLNQTLREKPSFIVNFRLPWGNCVFISEIPSKFVPFLKHRYEPTSSSPPSMEGMSPQEVCTSRFLMGDDEQKNKTLKIKTAVVKGPWIVKKVADNKPAIIGTKMPTHYHYEPENTELGLAPYLCVDLDIVASSAARGILAVAQRYTKSLTLDLGFVVEGRSPDELPEQMLMAMRLHSLDPMIAPNLPEDINSVHY